MRVLKLGIPLLCTVSACICMLVAGRPALSAENAVGVYMLGFRGPMAGFVPPPGVYLQNDVIYYRGTANASRELDFNGQLVAGVKAKMWVDAPTLLWSTPFQIAGSNLAFSVTVPVGGPTIDAATALSVPPLNAVLARNLHDSITTVGDPYLQAFLARHPANFHSNPAIPLTF